MHCSFFSRSVLLLAALSLLGVTASSAAVQNRISGSLSSQGRTAIPDSVHGRARLATDLGATRASTRLQGMTLRFSLTAQQQAALDQLLADQQNPASPRFHQWLTPAQYAAQFGLSPADLAQATAWLTAQGFTITEVANSATFVRFDGTVAQAEAAFSTSIHNLSLNGETHFANISDVTLPASLAGVVSGVTGLHNFKLKSRLHTSTVKYTSSISGSHYLAPGDFYTIYNETPLFNNGVTGAGVTIAVMGQVDISLADVTAFRSASGLSVNPPTVKTYGADPGSPTCSTSSCDPNDGDLAESSLDVEWAGATAPGANIVFVNSTDVVNISLTDAIDNNLAPIVTISYGDCEQAWGTSELNTLNQLMKQANAQGITVAAPAGDAGATDCDTGTSATQGLSVDFPASSPYATSMGGTMFNDGTATGGTNFWAASDSTLTAGAAVPAATYSALGYIPEAVWNEDTIAVNGVNETNTISAGGGGISAFFSKPAWQIETGAAGMTSTVPADASRDVPDLSLNAAANHEGYLYCVSGSCVNGFRLANNNLTAAGGTSFATPAFAGILALVEQKTASRLGNANPTIYALGNNAAYYNTAASSVFHDVTSGSNSSPCTAGTPNCSNGGPIGFNTGTGYDLATGWGTINAYNLVNAWGSVTPLGLGTLGTNISTTTVSVSPGFVSAGVTVSFTAIVTGTAGVGPTGTVQFLVNNVETGSPVTLASGAATYTYTTSCAALGNSVVAASYSGDINYAGSKGSGISTQGFTSSSSTVTPVTFQVTSGTCPSITVTPASTAVTVPAGAGTPTTTLTIAPTNGFTGTVVFSASAVENSNYAPGFSFSPASLTLSGSATASTKLSLTGITADLRSPIAPGGSDSGTTFARLAHPAPASWYAGGSGAALATLIFLVLPRRRRLGALLLLALGVTLACGGITGCSSGNSAIPASSATSYAGTYVVTVTATYTSAANIVNAQNTTITFVVQ